MFLDLSSLNPMELRGALAPGGIGRFMSQRKHVGTGGLVNDRMGQNQAGAIDSFVLDQEQPARLIVAKDRATMIRGLLTCNDVVSAVGLGVVVALVGSYSAPVTGLGVKRTVLNPIRQPVSAIAMLTRGIPVTTQAGRNMNRAHLKDRGFFVLLSGRTAVTAVPPGTRLASLGDYEVPLRDLRRVLPPE